LACLCIIHLIGEQRPRRRALLKFNTSSPLFFPGPNDGKKILFNICTCICIFIFQTNHHFDSYLFASLLLLLEINKFETFIRVRRNFVLNCCYIRNQLQTPSWFLPFHPRIGFEMKRSKNALKNGLTFFRFSSHVYTFFAKWVIDLLLSRRKKNTHIQIKCPRFVCINNVRNEEGKHNATTFKSLLTITGNASLKRALFIDWTFQVYCLSIYSYKKISVTIYTLKVLLCDLGRVRPE
jgi:phage FluMu protein Com